MTQQKHNSHRSKRPAVVKSEPKQVAEQGKPQLPRPTTEEEWRAHWKAQNQPWRTEPEISQERQDEVTKRRAITPDINKGIYPFGGMKLSRADVEWLLATHENGRGPIDWSDKSQQGRAGVDLRGADLSQENLSDLPLACMQGGLAFDEWDKAAEEQTNMAAVCMQKADLIGAHLQGAKLIVAHLQGAELSEAHLQEANLRGAQLQGADLRWAQLQGAILRWAQLQGANLPRAKLQGAHLRGAKLDGVYLKEVTLSDEQYGPALLADVSWDKTNLAVVDWSPVNVLGYERRARQKKEFEDFQTAVRENRQLGVVLRNQGLNEVADRFAYRAQVLQRKVLWYQIFPQQKQENEKKPWRVTLWQWFVDTLRSMRKFGSHIFSLFLDLLAGYGYEPGRTLGWYLLVISGFAIAYSVFGHLPLLPDTLVFSLMSFHGRGFFPSLSGETSLHNPLVVLAAAEAVIGLFIEISFIATFTQRFFGK